MSRAAGFTMIEMIIAMVILGIIGATFGVFILPMVNSHYAVQHRAQLVDSAESALRRMARDIRLALPNSVRVTNAGGFTLELIPTVDGGRYCDSSMPASACTGAAQLLDLSASDTDFDIVGCFQSAFKNASANTTYRLVIGDVSGAIYSAGGSPAVATPAGTALTVTTVTGGGATAGACGTSSGANTTNRHHVQISGGHQFSMSSGRQRVFVVQKALAYICDTSAGTLKRYADYDIGALPTSVAPSLVTSNVSACSINSVTSQVQSKGLVTLSISLTTAGETVTLMHQAQLDNSE
jgi:MSHA biogenesis protein MshO